ncbi:hypothetical protein TNCV_3585371 [Trichonephila clavipes]|nr:hypothetical protein TNCV_3585371 [Trichonephila clavipes]
MLAFEFDTLAILGRRSSYKCSLGTVASRLIILNSQFFREYVRFWSFHIYFNFKFLIFGFDAELLLGEGSDVNGLISDLVIRNNNQGRLEAWANWARAQYLPIAGGLVSFSTMS